MSTIEKGSLRTYLGIAPGVGKTYAMLAEGRQRAAAGEKVVVGWIEVKDRADVRSQIGELEMVAPREIGYRGHSFTGPDLEAIVASGADVVLIDELAQRSPDGSRRRWEDVADVLAAGLDVITTANVSNLWSVRNYAARIAGVGAAECIPDDFVRSGEVVLIDTSPAELRRRIVSGSVFSAQQVGGALAGYFRASNLEALSELTRAWIAGTEESVGADLLIRRTLIEVPEPGLVIAGDSGSEAGERVIREAAAIARGDDAPLVVVHVNVAGESASRRRRIDDHRGLAERLGGSYIEISGDRPADALASAARARGATKVAVARPRSRLRELTHGSVSARLRRLLPEAAVEEVRA